MLFLTSWQRCGKGKAKASTWACFFSSSLLVSSFSRFLYVLAVAGLSCPDVIGEVTFSKRFGFMDAGQDNGTFAEIEGVLRSAAWVGQIPAYYWLCDLLSPILDILGIDLGIQARHGALRKFA
jgi:hypothetical protein